MTRLNATQPKVSAQCLSDFVLDEVSLGKKLTAEAEEHTSCCSRCRERLSLFREGNELSSAVVEQLLLSAKSRVKSSPPKRNKTTTPWLTWPRLAFASGLCAIAVLFIATLLGTSTPSQPIANNVEIIMPLDGIRIKGTAVRVFLNRNGTVSEGNSGDTFRQGDALRFSVTNGNAGHFFLIGIEDGSGTVSAYHPYNGDRSVQLDPGIDIPLPGSLVLDDSIHTEYFIALFSQEPFELKSLQHALNGRIQDGETIATAIENLSFAGTFHSFVVKRDQQ